MTQLVVPFHPTTDERACAAFWVTARLQACHPSWELAVATEGGEPWTKARAANLAVGGRAYDANSTIVIHDADVAVSATALAQTVAAVESGEAAWGIPHGIVYRLDQASTTEVLALPLLIGEPHHWPPDRCARKPYLGLPGGGVLVVSAEAWAEVGGFDERFVGWSGEDVALGWALETLCGPPVRMAAPLWHLWHPPARRTRTNLYANQRLEAWYRAANGKPDAMRGLLAEAVQAG